MARRTIIHGPKPVQAIEDLLYEPVHEIFVLDAISEGSGESAHMYLCSLARDFTTLTTESRDIDEVLDI